ncbi:uncharacterized protein [Tiliqua scincoides]|uniref:uncharacterized protein n=1 Tax=Tiliqua scincoides TaxID=71010 RepID=UPI0034633ADA
MRLPAGLLPEDGPSPQGRARAPEAEEDGLARESELRAGAEGGEVGEAPRQRGGDVAVPGGFGGGRGCTEARRGRPVRRGPPGPPSVRCCLSSAPSGGGGGGGSGSCSGQARSRNGLRVPALLAGPSLCFWARALPRGRLRRRRDAAGVSRPLPPAAEPLPRAGAMGAAGEASVILIEDEAERGPLAEESEEFPLEEKRRRGDVVDEDREVVVTFCKQAQVMPHARYDCMTYPFERVECEVSCPLGVNTKICRQCYCYICDKLATECLDWTTPSLCHCNAHNKSKYWKSQWAFSLTGGLAVFNLELSEIDSDVRRGGELLQKFTRDVSVEYSKYLSGERFPSDFHPCLCYRNLSPGQCETCKLQLLHIVYRYTAVFDLVRAFLNNAEKESPKAEALLLLGAAKEIALHKDPAACSQNVDLSASLSQAVPRLMARITRRLQRLLVLNDFPKALQDKLVCFYQSIPFPTHCSAFSSSLHFMSWDHGLLTSVLKGQNVTGQRTRKGKKECLCEIVPVIEARIERMENLQQYRELIRYLKVVKCNNAKWMQSQRDKVPFYMCKRGDFVGAVQELFSFYPKLRCTACRLTPAQFKTYLKIFRTGCVPSGRSLEEDSAPWHCRGAPLKVPFLLKRTFMVLYSSSSLFRNPKCWSSVIKAFSSEPFLTENGHLKSFTLEEPPLEFQEMVLRESFCILEEFETKVGVQVAFSSEVFGTQLEWAAGLIFVVQALRKMILKEHRSLTAFLEIVLAFGNNFWALKLLFESLSYQQVALCRVINLILTDLNSQKANLLERWQSLGPQYVGKLLILFLTATDGSTPTIGISIMNIIGENVDVCPWVKQVGDYLKKWLQPFGWTTYEVSRFLAISQAVH